VSQPTYQTSKVWILPSYFIPHWADGLLRKTDWAHSLDPAGGPFLR
jgi:hypothetical protein